MNGETTLSENMADLVGLKIAYRAYKRWVATRGEPAPRLDGVNNDQLFFLAYAQTWCTTATMEAELAQALMDPHAPPRFRVNGSLANLPEFGAAFGCAPGTPMQRSEMCVVW